MLVRQGVIESPQIEEIQTAAKTGTAYVFSGERDSIVVVAQLSPEFTARLVDRWQELERRVAALVDPLALPSDPTALRVLLTSYATSTDSTPMSKTYRANSGASG